MRNWVTPLDPRCDVDALCLVEPGYRSGRAWREWSPRRGRASSEMVIMYALRERRPTEYEIEWLWLREQPPENGNAAYQQIQLDVYEPMMPPAAFVSRATRP